MGTIAIPARISEVRPVTWVHKGRRWDKVWVSYFSWTLTPACQVCVKDCQKRSESWPFLTITRKSYLHISLSTWTKSLQLLCKRYLLCKFVPVRVKLWEKGTSLRGSWKCLSSEKHHTMRKKQQQKHLWSMEQNFVISVVLYTTQKHKRALSYIEWCFI